MNISPLPWRHSGGVIYDADNNVVVLECEGIEPLAIANAEYIARAVSLYAEMADTINQIAQTSYSTRTGANARANELIDKARFMNRKIKEF